MHCYMLSVGKCVCVFLRLFKAINEFVTLKCYHENMWKRTQMAIISWKAQLQHVDMNV